MLVRTPVLFLRLPTVYLIYRPTRSFALLAAIFTVPGLTLGVRYAALAAMGEGRGHVQSVIACAALLVGGIFMAAIGILAYLLGINRRLLEEVRYLEHARLHDARRSGSPDAREQLYPSMVRVSPSGVDRSPPLMT